MDALYQLTIIIVNMKFLLTTKQVNISSIFLFIFKQTPVTRQYFFLSGFDWTTQNVHCATHTPADALTGYSRRALSMI